MVRHALADLLDQKTPFGRLALLHVVMTAGDTLVTVSLAGSLFFSISLGAAKNQVILYLLLTMAPFAVVAPLLGPVIDRSRGRVGPPSWSRPAVGPSSASSWPEV